MMDRVHRRGCPMFTHPTQRDPDGVYVCTCPGLTPGSQTARLVEFLLSHPEATSLEVTLACSIVNVTGRVSDARAAGHDVRCIRRADGRQGYVLVEAPAQLAMAL